MDYHANPDWLYSGDINAEYGGIWIKHCGDYADAVEITDLDSGCGFSGAVMIESHSAMIPREISEAKARIKSALSVYGWTVSSLLQFPTKAARRAAIWEAMIRYGIRDTDTLEILQLSDGPMKFDGWTAARRQPKGDIGGYVMAKYLD